MENARPKNDTGKPAAAGHKTTQRRRRPPVRRRTALVGESGKNKNKKDRPYNSRISPGASVRPICTSFVLHVRLVDEINCAKFYRNRLRGLDSVRDRNLTISIGLRCRR